jgi:hypothetical protein
MDAGRRFARGTCVNVTQEAARVDLSTLVRDPPWYLPIYWTPAQPPSCSPYVMERVLTGLRLLGPSSLPERR